MKFYAETRHFYRRTANTIWLEDQEVRTHKHEISEAAYKLFTEEVFADNKPLSNKDGSVSYSTTINSNECTETTFWIEA